VSVKVPEPPATGPYRKRRPLIGRWPTLTKAERRGLFEQRSYTQLREIFPFVEDSEVLWQAASMRANLLEAVYETDSVDLDDVQENAEHILNVIRRRF
jgi:hypothetical protein